MQTLMLIGNTKLTCLSSASKILQGTLSVVAIQARAKDLHDKHFVYKKYLGRFLVGSPFSKISADSSMFSNFIADFSKPSRPLFRPFVLILF